MSAAGDESLLSRAHRERIWFRKNGLAIFEQINAVSIGGTESDNNGGAEAKVRSRGREDKLAAMEARAEAPSRGTSRRGCPRFCR